MPRTLGGSVPKQSYGRWLVHEPRVHEGPEPRLESLAKSLDVDALASHPAFDVRRERHRERQVLDGDVDVVTQSRFKVGRREDGSDLPM